MQKIKLTDAQKLKLRGILNKYSSYQKFSANKHDAYDYTSTLGVRVCPYCNIHYTYTVYEMCNSGGTGGLHLSPVCRPDLDHFASKSDPMSASLSLQQENLIPACQQCNSRVKFRTKFNASTHVHPFLDDFDAIKKFSIDLNDPNLLKKENFSISFSNRSLHAGDIVKANLSIKDLKLVARYQYHKEEIVDLFQKAIFYHSGKLKEIEDLTGRATLRKHLFSDATTKINTVPLSKLRNDILALVIPN